MRLIIFFKGDFLLQLDSLLLRKILSLQNYVNLLFFYGFFIVSFTIQVDCFISAFPSLDNFSSVYQRKKSYHTNEINKELNKTCDLKLNDENGKKHSPLNFEKKKLNECNK